MIATNKKNHQSKSPSQNLKKKQKTVKFILNPFFYSTKKWYRSWLNYVNCPGYNILYVGSEVLLLFFEIEHILGVRLTCVVSAGMSMIIFVIWILLSKSVFCCAVLCENCKCREGRWIGNMLDNKKLLIGSCRLFVLVWGVVCIWKRDNIFLMKLLYIFLVCFDLKTIFLFILLEFISNYRSVGLYRVDVGMDKFVRLDWEFVLIWSNWVLEVVIELAVICLRKGIRGVG